MSFELSSFSPDFIGDIYEPGEWEKGRPITIAQAICELTQEERDQITRLACFPDGQELELNKSLYISEEAILEWVLGTNTVSSLRSPVEVWIDKEGYYKLKVYDISDTINLLLVDYDFPDEE